MIHQSILRYRAARNASWAFGLIAVSVAIYATQGGGRRPGGGTWQGYVLGTLGVLLILWLSWLGVRKRSFSSRLGSVQGWTAAHVWLGMALVVVATLHCAGEFGWNVHTLAYVLMCIVILSGVVGVYAYLSGPRKVAANSDGLARAALFAELFELDRKGRELARACDPAVNLAVKSSIERTTIGGGVYRQLLAVDRSFFMRGDLGPEGGTPAVVPNDDQQAVIDHVARRVPQAAKRAEAANLQALIVLLCRRQAVLRRIRRDIQLQAWLRLWLYVHVPLTVALIAALLVHITATFIYW